MRKSSLRISSGDEKLGELYRLLGTKHISELYDRYRLEDQKIIRNKVTDYFNSRLITNKVRKILEDLNPLEWRADLQQERRLILWLWYHHAVSYAIWDKKDKRAALKYSRLAIKYQPKNHSNKITKLLYFLVRDRLWDAKELLKSIGEEAEKETGARLVNFYQEGGFFV